MNGIDALDEVGALLWSTGVVHQVIAELGTEARGASHGTSGDYSLIMTAALHCCDRLSAGADSDVKNVRKLDCARALVICAMANESNEEGQQCLLSNEKRAMLLKLIEHLKHCGKKEGISINYTSAISSCPRCPLELMCRLHVAGVFQLEEYITLNINNSQAIASFIRNLLHAYHLSHIHDEASFTFTECMCALVTLLYGRPGYGSVSSDVQRLCHAVLMSVVTKLIKENEENSLSGSASFLTPLLAAPTLDSSALHAFTVDALRNLLTYNPMIKVAQAISSHHQWTYSTCSPWLCESFEKVLEVLKTEEIRDILHQTLQGHEVNWCILLTFVSLYVTRHIRAPGIMKEFIESLLHLAFENLSVENLVCAFLLARHIEQESPQYFPSYGSWFENYFGFSGTTYASTAKTFAFLLKFLTDIVPFEPTKYLKVHLQKPPYMTAKSRILFLDYTSLAKTRLQDLNEPTHYCSMAHREEHFEEVRADIVKILDTYRSTGKVPKSVIEMGIFKKPYYIQQFLPTLLDRDNFSDYNAAREKLVAELHRLGKVPGHLFDKFSSTQTR